MTNVNNVLKQYFVEILVYVVPITFQLKVCGYNFFSFLRTSRLPLYFCQSSLYCFFHFISHLSSPFYLSHSIPPLS